MSKKKFYKLWCSYRGTNYFGWQIQSGEKTIQGEINRSLAKICKSDNIRSIGASRTDAGVHAFEQIIRIDIPLAIDGHSLLKALNSLLPGNIRILNVENCQEDFHPIFDCSSKEYLYFFCLNRFSSPFINDLITYCPFQLDFELMKKGAEIFVGEHDFINYYCTGSEVKSTIRAIFEFEIDRIFSDGIWSDLCSEYYVCRIRGNGFLKQMVRLIVGSLFNLGRKKVGLLELEESLRVRLDQKLGAVAPPQGLYLNKIFY